MRTMNSSESSRSANQGWGFTLIELVVTLAIIAVVVSIALPALRSARISAQQGLSLNNLKQNADRFYVHAAERRTFPVAPHGAPQGSGLLQVDGGSPDLHSFIMFPDGGGMGFAYFANEWYWNMYLISLGDSQNQASWYSPSLQAPENNGAHISDSAAPWWRVGSHYLYSHAFMASPAYFRDPADRAPSMWRAIRPEETARPASKALLVEVSSGVRKRFPNAHASDSPTPIAFADGHADTRRLAEALPPAPNLLHQIPSEPLIQTFNGVLGWDFEP